MKQTRSLIVLCLCLLMMAAIPAAAQEGPLGVPLSPEQAAALPEALRSDPRAINGAIHITGFDQLGCNEFNPVARVTILVPGAHEGITIRTQISRAGYIAMNDRVSFTGESGAYPWILGGFTTGGQVSENWPLTVNTSYTLSMIMMDHNGMPLWYSEARFDCNAAPSFTESMSTPVRVISINSDFNREGTTSALAAKWTLADKARRTCTAVPGDCVIAMTAKPGKTAQITQNKRFRTKPGAGERDVFGLIVIYDTPSTGFVPGTVGLTVAVNGGAASGGQTLSSIIPVTALQTEGEIFAGMTMDQRFADEFARLNVNLSYSADAKSKLFVRSAYFWVADVPYSFGTGTR